MEGGREKRVAGKPASPVPRRDRRFHIAGAGYASRDGDRTLEEISEIVGLQVYTNQGVFLGNVNNLVVDVEIGAVDGLFVGETNPLLVEGGRAVSVPYRWIQSVGDIVILRYFPKRVSLRKPAAAVPAMVPEK
jgi:sporulation protein YlmC with PRC-barrel domain